VSCKNYEENGYDFDLDLFMIFVIVFLFRVLGEVG
jgi:hypothetical protein